MWTIVGGFGLRWFQAHRKPFGSALSWIDMEARFKDLDRRAIAYSHAAQDPNPLHAGQLDGQSWYISGSGKDLQREMKDLCAMAGRKLQNDGYARSDRLKRVTDDQDRWLWFLVEIGETDASERWSSSSYDSTTQEHKETHHFDLRYLAKSCVAGAQRCIRFDVEAT